jgi:hypothetical protein
MLGCNYNNKLEVRSKTARGYAEAVNVLFGLRSFPAPANFDDAANMVTILVRNLEKEEDIANQRSPLTYEIMAALKQIADESHSIDSAESTTFNIAAKGRITGPRCGEYGQKTQSDVEYHVYPSGNRVIKAWIGVDFTFRDKQKRNIDMDSMDESSLDNLSSVTVKWRLQKNRQNGQSVTIAADPKNPLLCPVRNAMHLVLRKKRLKHSLELPLAVFANKSGDVKYLTGSKITEILRKAAKRAHPDWTKEQINKISAHSIRVWACVLLSEAGKQPDFIKKRLRWMGDSYMLYLRDTPKISLQHNEALNEATEAIMHLISELPDEQEEDLTMGEWTDVIQ